MSPERTAKTEELQADLVVIGGGGAGMIAAVAAAEKGAKNTIVLEARDVAGGNSVYSISMFSLESPGQGPAGTNVQKDELFKNVMDFAHWQTNPRVTRALIDKAEDIVPTPSGQPSPFFLGKPGGERIGAGISKAMVKKCGELGVRILYQTKAKKLITKGGKVTGVLAEAKGKEINITAKSVIIATGGFAGNKELLKKYLPPYNDGDEIYVGGIPHMGDGLLMATEIGAATEARVSTEQTVNRFPWSACLFLIVKHPKTLWVNRKGERFSDESAHNAFNGQYRQPGKTGYAIIDEKIKKSIYAEELTPIDKFVLASNMTLDVIDEEIQENLRKEGLFVGDKPWPPIADKDLKWQASKGRVKIANSWDEIAKWMGADPIALKATIDEYNAACDKGHDDIFAKDKKYLLPLRTPPYYAIRCYLNILVTHGGIKINQNMEVLDTQDNPIPGLYAAGVEAASADFDTYGPVGAHGFGFAVNSGLIAGESAARFITGK
jgi:fumarate reductase flavoprotein subunit